MGRKRFVETRDPFFSFKTFSVSRIPVDSSTSNCRFPEWKRFIPQLSFGQLLDLVLRVLAGEWFTFFPAQPRPDGSRGFNEETKEYGKCVFARTLQSIALNHCEGGNWHSCKMFHKMFPVLFILQQVFFLSITSPILFYQRAQKHHSNLLNFFYWNWTIYSYHTFQISYDVNFQIADMIFSQTFLDPPLLSYGYVIVCGWPHTWIDYFWI